MAPHQRQFPMFLHVEIYLIGIKIHVQSLHKSRLFPSWIVSVIIKLKGNKIALKKSLTIIYFK